jgi:hypothetical protein
MNHDASAAADRRRFERLPVRSAARLHTQEATTSARLLNLSLEGALIDLGTQPDPGGRACIVTIPYGREQNEALALPARVLRRTRGTLAVKWARPLNYDARFKIKRLLERDGGEPNWLHRHLPLLLWPVPRSGRA